MGMQVPVQGAATNDREAAMRLLTRERREKRKVAYPKKDEANRESSVKRIYEIMNKNQMR